MSTPSFLPFALPEIGEDEIAEVVDSLRSGWVTTGPKAKRFEAQGWHVQHVDDGDAWFGQIRAAAVNNGFAGSHGFVEGRLIERCRSSGGNERHHKREQRGEKSHQRRSFAGKGMNERCTVRGELTSSCA